MKILRNENGKERKKEKQMSRNSRPRGNLGILKTFIRILPSHEFTDAIRSILPGENVPFHRSQSRFSRRVLLKRKNISVRVLARCANLAVYSYNEYQGRGYRVSYKKPKQLKKERRRRERQTERIKKGRPLLRKLNLRGVQNTKAIPHTYHRSHLQPLSTLFNPVHPCLSNPPKK